MPQPRFGRQPLQMQSSRSLQSRKPQQQKPTPSQPERTRKTKKVPEKVLKEVSNVWDTRSNEVSGPRKPAFDPLRAAKVQAEADQFRRDYVEELRGTNIMAQWQAARKLAELAFIESDNRAFIAAAGAIPPLVELLSSGNSAVQQEAAVVFRNLA